MIPPRRYFPWDVARRLFLQQFLFAAAALLVSGFSLRYYAYSRFVDSRDITQSLGEFDEYLTGLVMTMLAAAAIYSAYAAWKHALPLGRLIQRARELRRADARDETVAESVESIDELVDAPGEWLDLERALARIHRDLRQKTDALSREREELSTLIGAASDAILAINRDGDPLFFNTQFAVLFGAKGATGRAPRLDETFRSPEILRAYAETLETGRRTIVTATAMVLRDPRPRHFSVSVSPLKADEAGAVYGAIGIFHDVTELKQAEQIRIEFVANASHELRTPLTSIKGYVDTLREDVQSGRLEEAGSFLEIVSRNVDRLIFLVSDLLDLSTIESGAELQKTHVNVRETTESALRQLEGKRAGKRQEIVATFNADVAYADPRRLEQVVLNLVQNAIKYVPENRRIDVIWELDEAGAALLRVRDNGPGIPQEHQARLFERFYRIDSGRSRDLGGTGLGLAIVKHIMLKHGGDVSVRSGMGEGAEFTCRFPA